MKMLTGARCTASEQSWQTALVSPFFSFFLAHDWNKSRGPRWVGRRMCRCCSRFFDFPPAFAESSWQWGRPALFPRSTCDGQLQISHLISLSVYFCLTPFLSHIGIFLTTFSLSLPSPSFVFRFDLHEERTTFLSAQAAFLPVKKGWVRAAPSVSRIITGFCFFFFFVIPAEYEESQKTKFTERHCAIRGWGQIQCVPYRLKVLPQATLLWSISIDVSHGSSIAEWWDPVQGVSCSAFFSFFFFSPPSREWVWLTSSLHQGKNFPPPFGNIYEYICAMGQSQAGASRHKRTAPHTFILVYMNPTFIFHRKQKIVCFFNLFSSLFRLHLKPILWKKKKL